MAIWYRKTFDEGEIILDDSKIWKNKNFRSDFPDFADSDKRPVDSIFKCVKMKGMVLIAVGALDIGNVVWV